VAKELQQRALAFIKQRDEKHETRRRELGVTDDVAQVEGMSPALLVAVGEKGVKTLDDLADLAGDELVEIAQGAAIKLDADDANAIIMKARAHWFPEQPAADAAAPAAKAE
ncbi:MAG: transcription termination/antitermination protein NusA, partial [Alphaproteobacteria bacterium]|nr:transcription termination/antitermination protein NusA [Alphaproteobacteria bacterium]